jgi:hypothetical protein
MPVDAFVAWGDSLVQVLHSAPAPAAFFERFATPVAEPKDTAPSNILLEVASIEHSFVDATGKTLKIEDACSEVLADVTCSDSAFKHSFSISINDEPHKVWLRWDPERGKYVVLSEQLDAYHETGKPKVTLTGRLNQAQDFRIILASTRVLYAAGQFYNFRIRFTRGSAASLLLDLLTEIPQLASISTEKGERRRGTVHPDWAADSLFHFIDKGMCGSAPVFGPRFSHLVCDDMGTEGGDFIGIDSGKERVVFAQAKCKRDAVQVAASALYDVCAQANKNLGYLRYGGGEMPKRGQKWGKRWKGGSKDKTYEVAPRIRSGPKAAAAFFAELNAVLAKPGIRREMWLVLGKTLSKNQLRQELQASKPPANAIQTFYLLMSVHNACKSVGVELVVFCSP